MSDKPNVHRRLRNFVVALSFFGACSTVHAQRTHLPDGIAFSGKTNADQLPGLVNGVDRFFVDLEFDSDERLASASIEMLGPFGGKRSYELDEPALTIDTVLGQHDVALFSSSGARYSSSGRLLDPFRIELHAPGDAVAGNTTSKQSLWQIANAALGPGDWITGDFRGSISLACDVNADAVCDANDFDDLSEMIIDVEDAPVVFDVNRDFRVNDVDRIHWVHELQYTYLGDSNLDGEFTSSDLVTVFACGQYEDDVFDNSGWTCGDWNGDGDFTSSDLVHALQDGGYEAGPQDWKAERAIAAVPESSSFTVYQLFASAIWLWSSRLRRSHRVPSNHLLGEI